MKTTYAKVATAAAALLLSTAVQAKETVLKESGAWKALLAPNNDTGSPICAMGITNSDGRKFYIKYSDGVMFAQTFRTSWRLKGKQGTKVKVTIQFDDRTPFDGVGVANIGKTNGLSFLNVHIAAERESAFLQEVAEANDGVVSFPDGDEKPWGLRMTGSREVLTAFRACIANLEKRDANAPQPTPKDQSSSPEKPGVVPMEGSPAPVKKESSI